VDLHLNTIQKEDFSEKWKGRYFTDYPITLSASRDGQELTGTWTVNGEVFENVSSLTVNLLPQKNTVVFSE